MSGSAIDTVIGFVEGRVQAEDFERALQQVPEVEALLADDPDLPPHSYVGSSVFLFLLQLDLADPGGLLSAQGALSEWLTRHSISHSRSMEPQDFYDLLLAAQPGWLDVDAKWLQDELVVKSGGLTGDALKTWLHTQLIKRFRYVSEPPDWIQSPSWPISANGPLVFLGQVEVLKYFHDEAAAYVFHDPVSGECTTVIQVA
jgi:hypothetical protein